MGYSYEFHDSVDGLVSRLSSAEREKVFAAAASVPPCLLASGKKKSAHPAPIPKLHIKRLEIRGVNLRISKVGVLILEGLAVVRRLEVRWRHGG